MNIHIKCSLITLAVTLFVLSLTHWTMQTLYASFAAICMFTVYGLAYANIRESGRNK